MLGRADDEVNHGVWGIGLVEKSGSDRDGLSTASTGQQEAPQGLLPLLQLLPERGGVNLGLCKLSTVLFFLGFLGF
jgi:hypothetical protein